MDKILKQPTMTIKTILYSKTFPHPANGTWEKIALEAEITPTDDVRNCLYDLKKQVEQFHYESKGHDEKVAAEQKQTEPPQTTEAKIIAQIYGCSDLVVLKSFELLSKNNKAIKAAYEQQFEKLSKNS